jgi:hypothetical protein
VGYPWLQSNRGGGQKSNILLDALYGQPLHNHACKHVAITLHFYYMWCVYWSGFGSWARDKVMKHDLSHALIQVQIKHQHSAKAPLSEIPLFQCTSETGPVY